MAIVRWDPWRELAGLERQFDELLGRGRAGSRGQAGSTWVPALDVHQDGDTMVIRAEIAGVDPEKVEITIDDDVLTLSGKREEDRKVEEGQWIRRERFTGQFRRSISLPPGVDPRQVKANATNGVIEIRVPRPGPSEPHRVQLSSENGHKSTEIEVESGSTSGNGGSQGTQQSRTSQASQGSRESRESGEGQESRTSQGKSTRSGTATKKASKSSRSR
jgi:HSP20 family protein